MTKVDLPEKKVTLEECSKMIMESQLHIYRIRFIVLIQ